MRAGLYVLAPVSTNECAPSSTRITDVDVCRATAPALGRTFSVSGTFVSAPRGCYIITTTGAVWFNAHATGAGAADKQLVCYTGTPAPTNVGDKVGARVGANVGANVVGGLVSPMLVGAGVPV